ncbi:Uncharacterised protein [Edwardsiella tarda]|nr:Uncharacterised protein [Edwardsiella tarda]
MNVKKIVSISALTLLLTACGGGGRTVSQAPVPPAPVPPAPVPPAPVPPAPVPPAPVPPAPVPPAPVPPAPVPPAPVPPIVPPIAAARYDGKAVVSDNGEQKMTSLSGSSGTERSTNLLTIRVTNNTVVATLITPSISGHSLEDGKIDIKNLKDIDGSLLGYYGTVRATSVEPNRDGTAGNMKYPQLNILYAIDENKARLPANNNVQYTGTFQYVKGGDSTIRNSSLAIFSYRDKKIDGRILGDSGITSAHWVVDGDKTVDDDGKFNIRLKSLLSGVASGVMQGGFYGSEGQVMAGSAESQGVSTGQDEWSGVFIGEQQPIPKP